MSMESNHLFDIVDAKVLEDGSREEILIVACLALRCLNSIIDDNGTFKIKTYNGNHDCHLDYSHKSVCSKWLGRKYANHFKANNDGNWSFEGFKHQVSVDWKVDITKIQFYRARAYAQNMIARSVEK